MEQIQKICMGLLVLAATWGCADDKGSYEYALENKITIGGLKQEYRVIIHESISPAPTPELSFALSSSDVSYSWRIDYKEVCSHPSLDVPVEASVGTHPASLVVTDNNSSLRYFYDFTIHVETPYSQGLVVLGEEEDGTSLLSFQRRTNEGEIDTFVSDVFALENPDWGVLGKRPVALTMHNDTTYYLVLNKEGDKILTKLNANTMKMEQAFSLHDIPDCPNPWKPEQMKTCGKTTLILANGKSLTYDHSGCGRISTAYDDGNFLLEWLDTGGGYEADDMGSNSYTIGSAFPALASDGKVKQFVYASQCEGRNFTYDVILPFNEFADYDPEEEGEEPYEPVYLEGLSLLAGEKMYNKAGFTDWSGRLYPKELYSTALGFVFKDGSGDAWFYTYDFDAGLCFDFDWWTFNYLERFRPAGRGYGVTHNRTVSGLQLDANTVVKALPDGKYWLFANDNRIHCEYYHEGGRIWDLTLPSDVKGRIVKMLPSSDESRLYVALYDVSAVGYKGGIAVLDIDILSAGFGNVTEYYPNVCGKAVALIEKTGTASAGE